jgi:hypothetical protein
MRRTSQGVSLLVRLNTLYQDKERGWQSKQIIFQTAPSIGETIKINKKFYKITNIIHYAEDGSLEVIAQAE